MQIQIRILRFNPEKDDKPYFQDFLVPDVHSDWRLYRKHTGLYSIRVTKEPMKDLIS
jgi:succinate dehydrogenase/fumarate reductase-like Fe-S protein